MTVISHQNADQYLAGPLGDYFIFLVFGEDQGLIFERCQQLIRSAIRGEGDAMQIVEFASDVIAGDPLILRDEASAINMFGGTNRIIRVSAGKSSLLPALELVVKTPPVDRVIIIDSGELKRDDPLRKWIEAQSFAVSIECRADDARDIQRLMDAALNAAELSINSDARDTLGAMLGEDRLSTRSELDKLTLYARRQSPVTVEHINEILHDASGLGIDSVISAVFSGRPAQAAVFIAKAYQMGIEINILVAATLRYALAIHRCRCDIDCGTSFDVSLQTLLRQVRGYNRKADITNHLRQTSLPTLYRIINALFMIVKTTRHHSYLGEQRVTRLHLSLTTLMRPPS